MSGLSSNVYVDGKWYGPSYKDAGDPPAGAVSSDFAYEGGKAPKGKTSERKQAEDAGAGEERPTVERTVIERTVKDGEGVTREGSATRGRRGAR